MDNQKVDHVELSDKEMKDAVGGTNNVQNTTACLKRSGVTEKDLRILKRFYSLTQASTTVDGYIPALRSGTLKKYLDCIRSIYPVDKLYHGSGY